MGSLLSTKDQASDDELGVNFNFTIVRDIRFHSSVSCSCHENTAPFCLTSDHHHLRRSGAKKEGITIKGLVVNPASGRIYLGVQRRPDNAVIILSVDGSGKVAPLNLDPLLEDLAGNNLHGPFEVDRDQPVKSAALSELRFDVGA